MCVDPIEKNDTRALPAYLKTYIGISCILSLASTYVEPIIFICKCTLLKSKSFFFKNNLSNLVRTNKFRFVNAQRFDIFVHIYLSAKYNARCWNYVGNCSTKLHAVWYYPSLQHNIDNGTIHYKRFIC